MLSIFYFNNYAEVPLLFILIISYLFLMCYLELKYFNIMFKIFNKLSSLVDFAILKYIYQQSNKNK